MIGDAADKNASNSAGGPSIDPTKNVLNLVDAAVHRLDDLREMEARHLAEMVGIRSHYEGQLRNAESARIDAIRAVDVAAVQQAALVQEARAAALATSLAGQADTNRNQVATVAAAAQVSLSGALLPLQTSIDELRRNQFMQQGEKTAKSETQVQSNWNIGTVVSIIFAAVGIISLLLSFTGHAGK
jgi:hypothetical protein